MNRRSHSLHALLALGACLATSQISRADILLGVDFPATRGIDFPGSPAATVSIGSTVTADIRITGLDTLDLGGFLVGLEYNSSLLQVVSVTPGTGLNLGDPTQSSWLDQSLPGTVNTSEVSFIASGILASSQPSDFVLFTVTFLGLANGVSSFAFAQDNQLSDAAGQDFAPASIYDASITVVPEPETVGFASAAAMLAFASWRRWSTR